MRTVLNLSQYKDLHYADSDRINFENKKESDAKASKEQIEKEEAELLRKLEAGEISQQEYDTLSLTTKPEEKTFAFEDGLAFITPPEVDNSELLEQLTEEDYQYLMLK